MIERGGGESGVTMLAIFFTLETLISYHNYDTGSLLLYIYQLLPKFSIINSYLHGYTHETSIVYKLLM